jgi:hypothetical protein
MDCYTEPAPRGKRCTRCLCCEAVIVFAGEALCAACDDDTHPALPEQPVHFFTSSPGPDSLIHSSTPSPVHSEEHHRADAITVRVRGSNNHLTLKLSTSLTPKEDTMKLAKPKIEEAIRKAGPDEAAGDLAARLKLTLEPSTTSARRSGRRLINPKRSLRHPRAATKRHAQLKAMPPIARPPR